MLPVSAEESLEPDNQFHRRWMVHGTSHHLGLDVHDCAQARRELYLEQELKPGMIFTIEPGLYFIPPLLQDPARRATYHDCVNWPLVDSDQHLGGVRIEDNILVTSGAPENLTAEIPKTL